MASKVLICDNGTGYVKTGWAGSNLPQSVFPSMVGRPQIRAEMESIEGAELKPIMVGDEAAKVRFALKINYPVENGIVKHWEDMKHLWSYTFYEKLNILPSSTKLLLTEAPSNPLNNRKRTLEILFEEFGFSACHMAIQAILVLFAQGLMSGVVLDSGDGVSHVVPIYEGFVPPHLIRRLNVAGRHITRYLIQLMQLRGYSFNRTADFETVREIKEKLCYVAYDLDQERKLANDTTVLIENYTLPDNSVIKIGRERFEAPEALFDPNLVDAPGEGMSDMVFNMIQKADLNTRKTYYEHIVLSGGSTMYPGLPSRLEKDLKALYLKKILRGNEAGLKKMKIRVEAPPRRKHMVFLGASVFGDMMRNKGDEFWISKRTYEEGGLDRAIQKMSKGIR